MDHLPIYEAQWKWIVLAVGVGCCVSAGLTLLRSDKSNNIIAHTREQIK